MIAFLTDQVRTYGNRYAYLYKKLIKKSMDTREYPWVSKYLWITRIEIPT